MLQWLIGCAVLDASLPLPCRQDKTHLYMSSTATSSRPSNDASALAALFVTMSPRMPSTLSSLQMALIFTRKSYGI